MDQFDVTQLPELDQAVVIEMKDLRFKKFAHFEYSGTEKDKNLFRVCRPFGEWPIFYVPIESLVKEYAKDIELIKSKQRLMFPGYSEKADPNDERDNDWMNETCFSSKRINPEDL